MNCPYCLKEMARGYIYNGSQPIQWIPDGKKPSKINFTVSGDGVKLNNRFSFFKISGYSAEAFYCDACAVVIAKTER